MIVEKQIECRMAGETEVLGEYLPQRHFCPSQNPTWPDPGLNPGRRGGKPATNRLSYDAASTYNISSTMLQAGRSWDRVSMRWIFFILPDPSSSSMTLGSNQPLTEMSIGILKKKKATRGGKGRPVA
jgi:hypothetical protein